jgi:hypothetical protein
VDEACSNPGKSVASFLATYRKAHLQRFQNIYPGAD